MDLILSSGFLAFARHLGVLDAISGTGLEAEAVVGTSSGALIGALLQSGLSLSAIGRLLSEKAPIWWMRPHVKPWKGLFTPTPMVRALERHLPKNFEGLMKPLAVGVCDQAGRHQLLCDGDLMSALLASTAIPIAFPPVERHGHRYVDGGVADRTAVAAWRRWRPERTAIVHIVDRSRGREVPFDDRGSIVIRTPRANATFLSLGDFSLERREAQQIATKKLAESDLENRRSASLRT